MPIQENDFDDIIYTLIAAFSLCLMAFEGGVLLICCFRRLKVVFENHLCLFIYTIMFGTKVFMLLKLSSIVTNLLLWLGVSLCFFGCCLFANMIMKVSSIAIKAIQFLMVLCFSVHFLGVIIVNSILFDSDYYLTILYSLTAFSVFLFIVVQLYLVIRIRAQTETKHGKLCYIVQLIALVLLCLYFIHCCVLIFLTKYTLFKYICLINTTFIDTIVLLYTFMTVMFVFFHYDTYQLIDDDISASASDYVFVEFNFLVHPTQIREVSGAVIGKATYLGGQVLYKQIPLYSILDDSSLRDDTILLKTLQHPNIPKVLGVCRTNLNIYIIYNYHNLVTIDKLFTHQLKDIVIYRAITGILKGLEYLNKNGIIHYHLTHSSIVVNEYCDKVLLTDILPLLKSWFANGQGNASIEELTDSNFRNDYSL